MLFFIKMAIIGLIIGGVSGIIEEIVNATVKNKETAKTLNAYVTAIGWFIIIYVAIF